MWKHRLLMLISSASFLKDGATVVKFIHSLLARQLFLDRYVSQKKTIKLSTLTQSSFISTEHIGNITDGVDGAHLTALWNQHCGSFHCFMQKQPLAKCRSACYQQLAASGLGPKPFPWQHDPIKQHNYLCFLTRHCTFITVTLEQRC